MALTVEKYLSEDFHSFWDFKGKVEYVDKWFLMSNPAYLLTIWVLYMLFVFKIGPAIMKNRPAFGLNKILVVYNIAQVLISMYVCHRAFQCVWHYGIIDSNCAIENEESREYIVTSIYYYFLSKVTELLDTVFFVLRKKNSQVTFLHVYHHSYMALWMWAILKYEPNLNIIFSGVLNCYVHIVMYAYYGLSTYPSLAKYLWWKKYITSMQLVQFVLVIIQICCSWVYATCPTSWGVMLSFLPNIILFIVLFSRFYIKTYIRPIILSQDGKKANQNGISKEGRKNKAK